MAVAVEAAVGGGAHVTSKREGGILSKQSEILPNAASSFQIGKSALYGRADKVPGLA